MDMIDNGRNENVDTHDTTTETDDVSSRRRGGRRRRRIISSSGDEESMDSSIRSSGDSHDTSEEMLTCEDVESLLNVVDEIAADINDGLGDLILEYSRLNTSHENPNSNNHSSIDISASQVDVSEPNFLDSFDIPIDDEHQSARVTELLRTYEIVFQRNVELEKYISEKEGDLKEMENAHQRQLADKDELLATIIQKLNQSCIEKDGQSRTMKDKGDHIVQLTNDNDKLRNDMQSMDAKEIEQNQQLREMKEQLVSIVQKLNQSTIEKEQQAKEKQDEILHLRDENTRLKNEMTQVRAEYRNFKSNVEQARNVTSEAPLVARNRLHQSSVQSPEQPLESHQVVQRSSTQTNGGSATNHKKALLVTTSMSRDINELDFDNRYEFGSAKFKRYRGGRVERMKNVLPSKLQEEKSDIVVFQGGGNDLPSTTKEHRPVSVIAVANHIIRAGQIAADTGAKVCISSVLPRSDYYQQLKRKEIHIS